MTPPVAAARALEALIAIAASSGNPDAWAAAAALQTWLSSSDVPFEVCLNVSATWRDHRLRQRRDQLVHQIAARYRDLSGRRLARAVDAAIGEYEQRRWHIDRRRSGCEERDGVFFDLLSLPTGRPRFETLRKMLILGKESAAKYPGQQVSSTSKKEIDENAPVTESDHQHGRTDRRARR